MKKSIFIFICGDMASGKSTISREICKKFPELNYVNADLIRDYFRKNYPYYSDLDESYPTEKCGTLNKIVNPLRIDILQNLIHVGAPILFNMSGLTHAKRKNILDVIPDEKYTKILIQTQISEDELIQRIISRDKTHETSNNWERFHRELRIGLYEKVDSSESEHVAIYDQTNIDEIIELIEKHI